jgi:large subunit ribosomal protein L22
MNQIISATSKYLRISESKINCILLKIRNKNYLEVLQILKYIPQKAGRIIWKTLYSAISNAIHNYKLKRENLIIVEAFANRGSGIKKMKRVRFINKGRQAPIEKKISHLTICVSCNN